MRHLFNKKWWEAYINWKGCELIGTAKWRYAWWIDRCKVLKEELNRKSES